MPQHPPPWKLYSAFAVLYLGWGGAYVAALMAIQTIPPLLSCGSSFAVGGFLLSVWTWQQIHVKRLFYRAVLLGFLMICGGMGAVVWAEQHVASGMAALIISVEPVWMALYEAFVEHRRLERGTILGLVLGLLGLAYLCLPNTGHIDRRGLVVVLISGFCWVGGSLWSRRIREDGLPLTAQFMFWGGCELLLISALFGEWSHVHWNHISARSAWGWTYTTLVSSILGFACYLWLLRVTRVSQVSTYAFINPVISLFLGWWLAGEPFTTPIALASALLIAGVASITLSQRRRTPEP